MRKPIIPILALLIVGCASTQTKGSAPIMPEKRTYSLQTVSAIPGTELVAIFSGSCLLQDAQTGLQTSKEMAPLVAAVLAAVVPKAIDKGLDLLSTRLKAAAAAKTTSLSAHADSYLYTLSNTDLPVPGKPNKTKTTFLVVPSGDVRCLHVVAFADGTAEEADRSWEAIAASATKIAGQNVSASFIKNDPSASAFTNDGVPAFLAELRFLVNSDHSAFRVIPTFLAYPTRLGNEGSPDRENTLTLTLVISGADRKPFLADTINLGTWKAGVASGGAVMTRFGSTWSTFPTPPDDVLKLAAEFSAMSDKDLLINTDRIKSHQQVFPVSASVTLVETQEGKKWLAQVAEVLAASKEGVGAALTQELVPAKKEAAERAAMTAELGVRQALELALIDERAACAAWTKARDEGATDALTKWRTLVEARYKANTAAVAAGQPVSFSSPLQEDCSQP